MNKCDALAHTKDDLEYTTCHDIWCYLYSSIYWCKMKNENSNKQKKTVYNKKVR